MKNILIILCLTASICFANTDKSSYALDHKTSFFESLNDDSSEPVLNNDVSLAADFTFRVNVVNPDGTISVYIVTVHDVSWWNCKKMQLAVWWDRNF